MSHLAASHYRHYSWPLEVSGLAFPAHKTRSVASVVVSCLRSARDLKLNKHTCGYMHVHDTCRYMYLGQKLAAQSAYVSNTALHL